jgi:hypothetical protein
MAETGFGEAALLFETLNRMLEPSALKLQEESQKHALKMQRSSQAHAKEMQETSFQQQLLAQYGDDLTFDASGNPDFSSVDFAATPRAEETQAQTLATLLLEKGITPGTNEENKANYTAFNTGFNRGRNITSPAISARFSTQLGGDPTPGWLTQSDISDFENAINDMGGYENPYVLTQLIDEGFIDENIHDLVITNGVPTLGPKSEELIGYTMTGLKTSLINNNPTFASKTDYEKMQQSNRDTNIAYASVLVNNPDANLASSKYREMAAAFATSLGVGTDDEGETVIRWTDASGSDTKSFTGVYDSVKSTIKDMFENNKLDKRITDTDIVNFNATIEGLSYVFGNQEVGGTVSNTLEAIVNGGTITLNGVEQYKQLYLLQAIGQSAMVNQLSSLIELNQNIEDTSQKTMRYLAPPITTPDFPIEAAEASRADFRKFLQTSGLLQKIGTQRKLEKEGNTSGTLYITLVEEIDNIILKQMEAWDEMIRNGSTKDIRYYGQYMSEELDIWMLAEESIAKMTHSLSP